MAKNEKIAEFASSITQQHNIAALPQASNLLIEEAHMSGEKLCHSHI
jgi:hypothetical protein